MNEMMEIIEGFDGKDLPIRHIPGPEGVRGRNSDNALILEKLGWEPTVRLADGLRVTYFWIKRELEEVRLAELAVCFIAGVQCCALVAVALTRAYKQLVEEVQEVQQRRLTDHMSWQICQEVRPGSEA